MANIWMINQYSTTPNYPEDGRTYCFAKEMAKNGHQVHLFTASFHHLNPAPLEQKERVKLYRAQDINFVVVRTWSYAHAHSLKRIVNWFLFAKRLFNAARLVKSTPDVILVSTPSIVSYISAERLSRKYAARLIWDVRDPWPLSLIELAGASPRNPLIRLLQWCEDRACKTADLVISNSPYMLVHLESRGVSQEQFTWIPNGFYLSKFKNKHDLDADFINAIPKGKFIVAYTGTLGLANATDVLLDVAEELKNNPQILFLVVGGGKAQADFVRAIETRRLHNVLFMGRVRKDQVPSVLELSDCCYVGFRKNNIYRVGNALTKLPEYFASKKPIIFSITSPFKPVSDAQAGYTVEAEDVSAIAEAIEKMSRKSPEERAQMGNNGYDYAIKTHEYSVISKKLEMVLFDHSDTISGM